MVRSRGPLARRAVTVRHVERYLYRSRIRRPAVILWHFLPPPFLLVVVVVEKTVLVSEGRSMVGRRAILGTFRGWIFILRQLRVRLFFARLGRLDLPGILGGLGLGRLRGSGGRPRPRFLVSALVVSPGFASAVSAAGSDSVSMAGGSGPLVIALDDRGVGLPVNHGSGELGVRHLRDVETPIFGSTVDLRSGHDQRG